MEINEITYMQIRLVRLFSNRLRLSIANVHQMFVDHKIYKLIDDCYGAYHCGGDEIVYNDVKEILQKEGAIA